MKALFKPALLLAIVALCLFEYVLDRESAMFREFEATLLQTQWMLLVCLAVWCGTFLFLTFSLIDLPLIGLLVIAIIAYFISMAENRSATDAVTLLFGVTLGRGARFALMQKEEGRLQKSEEQIGSNPVTRHSPLVTFLSGLVVLLAFSSFWHLDMTNNFYHGPRWMGLWNNPNDYGMLMSAGLVLAVGLLAAKRRKRHKDFEKGKAEGGKRAIFATKGHKEHKENSDSLFRSFLRLLRFFVAKLSGERSRPGCGSTRPASNTGDANDGASLATRGARVVPILLLIAAGMMGVGLLFSYSRGSWLGAAIGLLYLAKAHGKFKWRSLKVFLFSGFCFLLLIFGVWFFWNNTPDSAPWFVKRLDLGRASAQHRVAAWKAGFEIMRDHPFGVGWNKAIDVYQKDYSPPEDGAAAITTNDYLVLGTQLGWAGLICFVTYCALCFCGRARHSVRAGNGGSGGQGTARPTLSLVTRHLSPAIACHSAVAAMAVAFWFDYGLFKLATTTVFWILLELGAETQKQKAESEKAETNASLN